MRAYNTRLSAQLNNTGVRSPVCSVTSGWCYALPRSARESWDANSQEGISDGVVLFVYLRYG